MKILFITHDIEERTGTGIFSRNIVEAIRGIRPDWQMDFLTAERSKSGTEAHSLLMTRESIWKNFFEIRRIIKSYDVVHALDGFPYGVIAIFASLGTGKKVFITAIGSGAIFMSGRWIRNLLLKFSYNMADQIFVPSSHIAKRIHEVMPDLDIMIINHGIGQIFINKASTKDLKLSEPYILTVGYLKKRKGYEYSIKAFSKCLDKNPEMNYVIVGNPLNRGYQEKILKLIKDLGIKERVFFYENLSLDELASIYAHAKLFLLTPQETPFALEGFGMVYLEAASFGLPVVGSKDSSADDAVRDGKNGFLVPAQDTDAIAEAVSKILNDADLAQSMSMESIIFAKLMTWEKAAGEYITRYEDTSDNKSEA